LCWLEKMEIVKDEFGPEYVLEVYDPDAGMSGFLVIDNTVLGPGKGGIRMTPDVTIEEVFRLARTMTWKNAIAGIPFGGAKAGIVWPPPSREATEGKGSGDEEVKKLYVQSFARAVEPFIPEKYIAGPDVNSGEKEMQWFAEAVSNWKAATGKPSDFCMTTGGGEARTCGLPHELGSTGFGVAQAAKVAAEIAGIGLKGVTVAIEGFGNVGSFAFKYLSEMGAKIVAVSDSRGAAYLPEGLDDKILHGLKASRKSVADYPGAKTLSKEELFELQVDILIPAAVTDVINEKNKDKIRAKIIVEGANIPMKERIENELWQRGVVIVPDFVANAGGVISSYAEYMGFAPKKMFALVKDKVSGAAKSVLEEAKKSDRNPRAVAMEMAQRIVKQKSAEPI